MTPLFRTRRFSVLLVTMSAIGFSFNGLIVRLIESATPFQAIFYRSLGMSAGLLLVYALIYRRRSIAHIIAVGPIGVLGAALMAASAVGMVFAMYNATVANVVYVSSAIPFITAALAWLVLREKVPMAMLGFMATSFAGVTVMVGGAISLGAGFGNFMALFSAFMYGLFVIVVRRQQQIDMTPMVALAGVWICLVVPFLAEGDLKIGTHDLLLCIAWGAIIAAAGHSMFVMAARNLPGAEVTFLMLLEFVLAPVWVWLIVDEVPAQTTLIGGVLVVGSLAGWTLTSARKRNLS